MFAIEEIIRAVAESFDGDILYTIDQLSGASIEVSADSTDIVDKKGAIIRRIYNSKQATLTANLALLSPVALAALSGTEAAEATVANAITMPEMVNLKAGATIDVTTAKAGTIKVFSLYNNGANGEEFTQGTAASLADKEYALVVDSSTSTTTLTVPAKDTTTGEGPDTYLIIYDKDETTGLKIANIADQMPDAVKLTIYAAAIDPCDDQLKSCIIVAPNAQADPSMTINLDAESTETDITYNLNVDYCGDDKVLYYIYFPDRNAVTTVSSGIVTP